MSYNDNLNNYHSHKYIFTLTFCNKFVEKINKSIMHMHLKCLFFNLTQLQFILQYVNHQGVDSENCLFLAVNNLCYSYIGTLIL